MTLPPLTRLLAVFALVALIQGGRAESLPAKPAKAALDYTTQLAAQLQPSRILVYKKVGDRELRLDVFLPADLKPADRRAGLIAFHGGGWTGGNRRSMYPYAAWAAEHGLVAVSVEYRLYQPKVGTTVFDCVQDARSALRYVRVHAAELGLDPARLVSVGSSAGGLLAAGTELFDHVNETGDDLAVSPRPEAMILLWPVIDTSGEGYGQAKIGERWRELSPLHHVRPGMPPTLVFHGTSDATVPFRGAQNFRDAMLAAGNRCEFVIGPGGGHGFITKEEGSFKKALSQIEVFLDSLHFLPRPAGKTAQP